MLKAARIGERAEIGTGLIEPANRELVRDFGKALGEALIGAVLDVEPARRGTHLPAIAEFRPRTSLCRNLDIRIRKDQHRRVPAELHRRLLDAVRAQMKQLLSACCRA